MFYTNDKVFCPVCEPIYHRKIKDKIVGPILECIETNYHGCGVDHAECPKCKKFFSVSYKVDTIEEIKL